MKREKLVSEPPKFSFALREDLKEDKRFLPTRAEPFATGYDVRAAPSDHKQIILWPGKYFKIPLGFRALPHEGWWFQLHPRSSSFVKKYMHSLIGIIDEHYSHEVIFAGQYLPEDKNELIINHGDPIGQIIPVRRQEMQIVEIDNKEYDDLCEKRMAIRDGGFGSTDKLK